jgi:hypothetical protein
MAHKTKPFFIFTLLITIVGCAAQPQLTPEQRDAVPNLMRCMESQPNGKKSSCVMNFYGVIQRMPDDDYAKGPVLNFATNLYVLVTKAERGQIKGNDIDIEWMRINNQMQREVEVAKRRNAEQIRRETAARQEYWLNVQRIWNQGNQQPVYIYQNNPTQPRFNSNSCQGVLANYGHPCWGK